MNAAGAAGPTVVVAAVELPSDVLDIEQAVLAPVGATVLDRRDLPLASLREELARADGVLTEGIERLGPEIIRRLGRCRVISVYAVGTDGVDVEAATRHGIPVANVPDYCTAEVAEHTIALILAAWRRLPRAERVARTGSWALDDLREIRRLTGRTLGLLGFGRIAREVAARARGLGVELLACDPHVAPDAGDALGVRLCARDELLRRSDVLSIHVPLTPGTAGSVDAAALALLPPGAIVVNAGRGGVVDEEALLAALRSGRLAGAALDVLRTEPPPPDHPLLALETVICTPHMAYYSVESLADLRRAAAGNVRDVLAGKRPASVVNDAVLRRNSAIKRD
jgi:D-3-phosphoglycerate dehydrogenase / 2-oxoglutarate reductase